MLGTIKYALKRSVVHNGGDWTEIMPKFLYGYRRRERGDVNSPFRLMYGIEPRMMEGDTVALLGKANPIHRLVEMLEGASVRAAVVEARMLPLRLKGRSNGSTLETKC